MTFPAWSIGPHVKHGQIVHHDGKFAIVNEVPTFAVLSGDQRDHKVLSRHDTLLAAMQAISDAKPKKRDR